MGTSVRLAFAVVLLAGLSGRATAQEEPRAVIERAITAHGGAERLAAARAGQTRTRGTVHLGGGIAFTAESWTQLPGRLKNVMQFTTPGGNYVQTQVLDGDRAWLNVSGKTQELDARAVAEIKENLHAERLAGLVTLRESGYELTPLAEVVINGRPAVGVKVTSAGHRDLSLYFDKPSGLLVRTVGRVLDAAGQEVTQEKTCSGFKEMEGILRPTRVAVLRDGKLYLDLEVLEHKTVDRFPDGTFGPP
jgi:hypothetical protein